MLNGTDAEVNLPLNYYKEVLEGVKQGRDIITDKAIAFGEELKMTPRESLIIEW